MGKVDEAVHSGVHMALRELATSAVKVAYERLTRWRLGPTRSQPFLRNGPNWVIHVLTPRHKEAGSTAGTKLFSYTFALLHANALFYAAECTVAVGLHTWTVVRDKHRRPAFKAQAVAKGVLFHTTRCTLLLISTSAMSALGTLARPGFGTRVSGAGRSLDGAMWRRRASSTHSGTATQAKCCSPPLLPAGRAAHH